MPQSRRPGVSLRIDFGTGARIGPGKIALLEAVQRTGSISAAGRDLGMSYRRAWMLADALNRSFDTPVIAAMTGGPRGGGANVTPFGAALVAAYRDLETTTALAAETALADISVRLVPDPGGEGAADDE